MRLNFLLLKQVTKKLTSAMLLFYAAQTYGEPICDIEVEPLNFGAVNPDTEDSKITTNIIVTCNDTDDASGSYTILFSSGDSDNNTKRFMKNQNGKIEYNFYKNSDHSGILGDGYNNTEVINGYYELSKSNNYTQSDVITIYGNLPVQPGVAITGKYKESMGGIKITLKY